jgi:hypothetical protein
MEGWAAAIKIASLSLRNPGSLSRRFGSFQVRTGSVKKAVPQADLIPPAERLV